MTRHLGGILHKIAIENESRKGEGSAINDSINLCGVTTQKRIDVMTKSVATEAHKRMMKTAYELALHPNMPLANFEVLVKVQRMNGVRLIQGVYDLQKLDSQWTHNQKSMLN